MTTSQSIRENLQEEAVAAATFPSSTPHPPCSPTVIPLTLHQLSSWLTVALPIYLRFCEDFQLLRDDLYNSTASWLLALLSVSATHSQSISTSPLLMTAAPCNLRMGPHSPTLFSPTFPAHYFYSPRLPQSFHLHWWKGTVHEFYLLFATLKPHPVLPPLASVSPTVPHSIALTLDNLSSRALWYLLGKTKL